MDDPEIIKAWIAEQPDYNDDDDDYAPPPPVPTQQTGRRRRDIYQDEDDLHSPRPKRQRLEVQTKGQSGGLRGGVWHEDKKHDHTTRPHPRWRTQTRTRTPLAEADLNVPRDDMPGSATATVPDVRRSPRKTKASGRRIPESSISSQQHSIRQQGRPDDPFVSPGSDAQPQAPHDAHDGSLQASDLQTTPRARQHSAQSQQDQQQQQQQQQRQQQQPFSFNAQASSYTTMLKAASNFSARRNTKSASSTSRDDSERASDRTRSTSPVKNADDLHKLKKPVSWATPDPRSLRAAVKATGSAQGLGLFDDVWAVTQGERYLPRGLQSILQDELMVSDSRFAKDDELGGGHDRHDDDSASIDEPVARNILGDDARQLFDGLSTDEAHLSRLLALHDGLRTIRDVVASTVRFVNTPRSEAAWNDHIHGPMLRLAVSPTARVGAENITQAAIAKNFVPASRGELETMGPKMIDYALVLRPDRPLANRIADFVDGVDAGPRTFNQSTYGSLCYEPTGVFIETKVDIRRRAEAKAQLGIWLASWFGRVTSFAPLSASAALLPNNDMAATETSTNLPFVPVMLVVCEVWELYFAFDRGHEFQVCGPLQVGTTMTVDGAYKLLAVLRLLAGWVDGEFRDWVERCVA